MGYRWKVNQWSGLGAGFSIALGTELPLPPALFRGRLLVDGWQTGMNNPFLVGRGIFIHRDRVCDGREAWRSRNEISIPQEGGTSWINTTNGSRLLRTAWETANDLAFDWILKGRGSSRISRERKKYRLSNYFLILPAGTISKTSSSATSARSKAWSVNSE